MRVWRRNGTLEIGLGGCLLGVLLVDRCLHEYQMHQRLESRRLLQADANAYHDNPEERQRWMTQTNVLFRCVVRQLPGLDGTKCLTHVRVGDVVEVLEEQVGPGQVYHLCRRKGEDGQPISVGWFPTFCLERISA